jgi:hypothetical protein
MFIFYHYLSDTPGLNIDTCRIIYAEKTGGKQLGARKILQEGLYMLMSQNPMAYYYLHYTNQKPEFIDSPLTLAYSLTSTSRGSGIVTLTHY